MENSPLVETTQKQKKSKWRLVGWIVGIVIVLWVIIYFLPVPKMAEHPYFETDRPLVIAHGGGQHLAPTETMEAFQNAAELGVDVIEFNIHMTTDGHLVAIHDPTVDRTTDGEGNVNDMTLEEVQALDAAVAFQDLDGEYSFRDQGVSIPTVKEAFEAIPDMRWNIEIKDSNDPELFQPIAEKLWKLIQEYGLEEDVLVVSFDQDIVDMVLDVSDGQALVSGGRQEITKFVILQKLFLNGLYWPNVNAIQIPMEDSNINLKSRHLIRSANRAGMDVHYWTINDKETMKELIDLGADGILTDRPDVLLELLEED